MKEVKRRIDGMVESKLAHAPTIASAASWYLAEAELWLLQERAK